MLDFSRYDLTPEELTKLRQAWTLYRKRHNMNAETYKDITTTFQRLRKEYDHEMLYVRHLGLTKQEMLELDYVQLPEVAEIPLLPKDASLDQLRPCAPNGVIRTSLHDMPVYMYWNLYGRQDDRIHVSIETYFDIPPAHGQPNIWHMSSQMFVTIKNEPEGISFWISNESIAPKNQFKLIDTNDFDWSEYERALWESANERKISRRQKSKTSGRAHVRVFMKIMHYINTQGKELTK